MKFSSLHKHFATLILAIIVAACGIQPVEMTDTPDRDSVITRRPADATAHAEQLRASGVKPLSGQNIAYTLDQLEAQLRRSFAGTVASITRQNGKLLLRCPTNQVFNLQSDLMHEEFSAKLDVVARTLQQHPALYVQVGVHVDSAGGQRMNFRTTEDQLTQIVDRLVAGNVPESHILATAFGESDLLVEVGGAEEREVNNRVEFLFHAVTAAD